MLLRLFLIFIFSLPLHAEECLYKLSLGAIFQNEAPYLKEWIEYHRIVGIEHFWLYNNESEDNYLEILQPYIDEGVVDLIQWPTTAFPSFHHCQMASYRDCLANSIGVTKWLTIIDIDEFIVPVKAKTIPEFLKNYDDFAGILVNWQMYGTSHEPSIPEGKTLVETLVWKAAWDYNENTIVKMILRPERIKRLNLHEAFPQKGFSMTTPQLKGKRKKDIQIDEIRINHYWTRAEDYFFGYKIPRAERIRYVEYSDKTIERILRTYNSVEDRIMDRFLPQLRERLGFN